MVSSAVAYICRSYSTEISITHKYEVSEVGEELVTSTSSLAGNFNSKYVSYPFMSNPYDWIDYD